MGRNLTECSQRPFELLVVLNGLSDNANADIAEVCLFLAAGVRHHGCTVGLPLSRFIAHEQMLHVTFNCAFT